MKTTDISVIIIIHMQSKQNSYFLSFFIGNIGFQRSKGGFRVSEKDHNFTFVSSGMYLMTTCCKSGIIAVHNYKNKDYATTQGRQNVTGESTTSGL